VIFAIQGVCAEKRSEHAADLIDEDQGVAHEDAREPDQSEDGVEPEGLMKDEQASGRHRRQPDCRKSRAHIDWQSCALHRKLVCRNKREACDAWQHYQSPLKRGRRI